ncbi:MAG: (Fe-S)-binding protein [bacterium]
MGHRGYSARELIQAEACTHCSVCTDVCPAVSASRDGRLSGLYRLGELKRIQRSRYGVLHRLLGRKRPQPEQLKPFGETVFRCTLCGRCQEVCPSGILLKDLWLSLREDLVVSSAYPNKIDGIRENLSEAHNVFAEDDDERGGWVENMRAPPAHGYVRDRAEVVYFTGCVAAYFPMAQQIPVALAELFGALEVDFTLLGPEEWCCGFPLVGAGLRQEAAPFIRHNLEAVLRKRATRVVFACPTCYQMWREHYPYERHGLEIRHVTEFLHQRTARRPLPLAELPLTVTYHDPCDLGRGARVFEAPRELVRSIPGVRLVELAHTREDCRCCGGGGNLEMIDAKLSGEIAREKIGEALATGTAAVVTSCQQCVRTLATYAKRNKVPLEVLDVVQLLRRALRK